MSRLRTIGTATVAFGRRHRTPLTLLGLAALATLSLWLRTRALWAKFWIDEGISVGIAHHPLSGIPSLLQQDGAPPFYYLLLHLWMKLVGGDGEARTHALSVLAAVAAVPAGWWWGRRLFGRASGWATAMLLATLPFLTYYAQETRMYALVVLLGTIAAGAFAAAFALGRRAVLWVFVPAATLVAYTHNWGLFLLAGFACGWLWLVLTAGRGRRRLLRDGVLSFAAIGGLYLPWVPTVAGQGRSTGAPWSERPGLDELLSIAQVPFGGTATALALALVAGGGLARMRRAENERARAAAALAITLLVALLAAWAMSQISPAWARRYVAVVVGPALLLAGAGLVRAGRVGLLALAVTLAVWWTPQTTALRSKSNVFAITRILEDEHRIAPGDAVLVLHPEYTPTVRYYLGPRWRWFDALGPVPDPRVFDWRHVLDRLQAAGPRRTLARILPQVPRGRRLVVFFPIVRSGRWNAPWTALVRRRSDQWAQALALQPGLVREGALPAFGAHRPQRGLRVVVYRRT